MKSFMISLPIQVIYNNKLKKFIKWKPKFNNLAKIVKSCIDWEKKSHNI